MSDIHDPTTPEEVDDLLDRLVFTDEPVELPVVVGQDADTALKPRSVKMTDDMYRRAGNRAVNLGMSVSAYLRSLIERDLVQVEHKGSPVAELSRIAAELFRAAAELDHTATELGRTA
ncbi:hypothetical protein GPX89_41815 [Nocardia sp. ET3-3]|uniref:Uncharacterized protein n=1 Tax=Nocardia terrae TaxID=2675851 RepID=A0A7K1VB81_9NOCA|nr:hypothetical protein [Nocardia terrae]MVU83761.1 hypothetical protein [Nocardia terrae]